MMTRSSLITVIILVAFLAWFTWGLYNSARQARLSRQLVIAVGRSNVNDVNRLLADGADPNTREGGDPPPTWQERWALLFRRSHKHKRIQGRPVIVVAALGPDGSPASRDIDQSEAQIIRMLVAKGADVNARDDTAPSEFTWTGDTALIVASKRSLHSTVLTATEQALLGVGADTNAADDDKYTALYQALSGNAPLVRVLLERGAPVNGSDFHGLTPLINAVSQVYSNRQPHDPTEIPRLLIARGANVNARDIYGDTALYWAVHANETDLVRLLIANGADVNVQGQEGATPLMTADGVDVARLLIAHGADVNFRDKYGKTVLWYSRHTRTFNPKQQKHAEQMTALLVQNGATE
jgi:ankyrin repeat protein